MFMPRTQPQDDEGKKRQHLSVLRSIVQRMSFGSHLVRGWSSLLVAALVAVASIPEYFRFGWLAIAMAIGFWMLDAHLSRQRNLYEKAHRRVTGQSGDEVDYSLDISPVDNEADAWRSRMFAPSLAGFHLFVVCAVGVAMWLLSARGS